MDEYQGDQRRQSLDPQDLPARGQPAENAGDQHAGEEEQLHAETGTAGAEIKTPDQSGSEEAVVEPLVGGERLRLQRKLRRGAERATTGGSRPQEHFQDQE